MDVLCPARARVAAPNEAEHVGSTLPPSRRQRFAPGPTALRRARRSREGESAPPSHGASSTTNMARNGIVQLALCAVTIYTMFLVWGLLQEKSACSHTHTVTSTVYYPGGDRIDPFHEGERFEYGVLLNAIQAVCSCLAALTYLIYRRRAVHSQGWLAHLGLDVLTPSGCHAALVQRGKRAHGQPLRGLGRYVSPLLQQYLLVAALQSTASWLSIVALRHLSFPAITLAKSSKLVPVLLMNVLLYRRSFPAHKYIVVFLVTLGVWMFMALGRPRKAAKQVQGSSALGVTLLIIHLLIDGTTNSTQDEIFAKYGALVSGPQMMLVMNAISASYLTGALLVPEGFGTYALAHVRHWTAAQLHPHWIAHLLVSGVALPTLSLTPQLVSGLQFLLRHPDAARDVLMYAGAGALGQIAIFETLERFGSLTLVSITVRQDAHPRLRASCSPCCCRLWCTSTTCARGSGSAWLSSLVASLLSCGTSSASSVRLAQQLRQPASPRLSRRYRIDRDTAARKLDAQATMGARDARPWRPVAGCHAQAAHTPTRVPTQQGGHAGIPTRAVHKKSRTGRGPCALSPGGPRAAVTQPSAPHMPFTARRLALAPAKTWRRRHAGPKRGCRPLSGGRGRPPATLQGPCAPMPLHCLVVEVSHSDRVVCAHNVLVFVVNEVMSRLHKEPFDALGCLATAHLQHGSRSVHGRARPHGCASVRGPRARG